MSDREPPTDTHTNGTEHWTVQQDGESIGALIRRRRRDLGLSQAALARLLIETSGNPSITRERISEYEHEKYIPDDWLEGLSVALEISLDELAGAALRAQFRRRHHHQRNAAE